jgi:carbonic anhydrase
MPFDLPFRPSPMQRPPVLSVRRSAWTALAFVLAGAWIHPSEAAEAEHHGEARPAASSPRASAEDPMDMLRQKLAERLGAQKPDARGANMMRVDNRNAGAALPASSPVTPPRRTVTASASSSSHGATPAPKQAETAARPPAHPAGDGHWDYEGEAGPESWGRLKPEFAKCSTGERQSPIDIRGGIAVQLEPIQFDYRTTGFSVIDNGHTVQVNLPAGNAITVLGRRFELLQFHFHRPSEERINGRQYDMVAHLVHKDAEGKLAVVAVLLDRGVAQPVIQAVWNALPLEKYEAQPAPGTIDLNKLLPEDRRYYTYMGSLTTPPCSEGVLWMVMKTPVPVSPEQVDIFAHLYPMNARPVQRVAGRLIKESN